MVVDVSPEPNAGNGSVDFKFSRGARAKTIVELKRASSSHLRSNLLFQLPAYMDAESTESAFLLIVQSEDKHCTPEFVESIESFVAERTDGCRHTYEIMWIDARQRPTGSRRTAA